MATEKRLIDANKYPCQTCEVSYCHQNCAKFIAWFESTVDAVEVVHNEWACVNESDNVYMCTGKNGCGGEIILLEGTPLENNFIYCPYCGARMDGK